MKQLQNNPILLQDEEIRKIFGRIFFHALHIWRLPATSMYEKTLPLIKEESLLPANDPITS
jgi:hypothetical protein